MTQPDDIPEDQVEELRIGLEEWLEAVLESEEDLVGVDAELYLRLTEGEEEEPETPDLLDLHSGLVALRQEVKVQGREFARLHDQLKETAAPVPRAESEVGPDETLLIDLRDRLLRGAEAAARQLQAAEALPRPGWLARILGADTRGQDLALEACRSLEKGYSLTLERLEQAVQERGIQEISCQDRLFDPASMEVVDLEERPDLPEGTVLEVLRRGYLRREGLLRTAQVKVSRKLTRPELVSQKGTRSS